MRKYVIGIDYGTDSCRALVVDSANGREAASAVCPYPRWKKGLYCDARGQRYRQHPLDYTESLETAVRGAVAAIPADRPGEICALAFDTTGSTPVLTDAAGTPLALSPRFAEEPDAMFVLWKDHTAIREAAEINAAARRSDTDYTRYSGGIYSAEWVWSKVLHILKTNPSVAEAAYAWVEHCDWMCALLTGNTRPEKVLRSRCAAGHKGLWHAAWGGWPPAAFLDGLRPGLGRFAERMSSETHTAERYAGGLCGEWAARLGLPAGIPVAVGAIDAHVGAVGAGIRPGVLTRIMGTSTCDIVVCPAEKLDGAVRGICGQVDGSVLPGCIGMEAGQSAFGDVYAWFRDLLMWPVRELLPGRDDLGEEIIPRLGERAALVDPRESSVLALDWLNGRRTPDANPLLTGALTGLTLGTSAPMIFRALVEATAYGSRAIAERFTGEGVEIRSILAIGGIAVKSPFVMQTLSDVLGMPIRVVGYAQTCALGAAMCAAVAAGIHPTVGEAQAAMGVREYVDYTPDPERCAYYERQYERYAALGRFVEQQTNEQ